MITLTPAYGRDYGSVKAVKEALANGQDFVINDAMSRDDGRYCSPPVDLKGQTVKIRYAKLRKVTVIHL